MFTQLATLRSHATSSQPGFRWCSLRATLARPAPLARSEQAVRCPRGPLPRKPGIPVLQPYRMGPQAWPWPGRSCPWPQGLLNHLPQVQTHTCPLGGDKERRRTLASKSRFSDVSCTFYKAQRAGRCLGSRQQTGFGSRTSFFKSQLQPHFLRQTFLKSPSI